MPVEFEVRRKSGRALAELLRHQHNLKKPFYTIAAFQLGLFWGSLVTRQKTKVTLIKISVKMNYIIYWPWRPFYDSLRALSLSLQN